MKDERTTVTIRNPKPIYIKVLRGPDEAIRFLARGAVTKGRGAKTEATNPPSPFCQETILVATDTGPP